MKSQYKIIFWPVVLFIVGTIVAILYVREQTSSLENEHRIQLQNFYNEAQKKQQEQIRKFYVDNKDMELENYYTLAKQSIEDLLESGISDAEAIEKAKAILSRLSYGQKEDSGEIDKSDGYFFLFDKEGTFHFHPRQPNLVGKNFLETVNEGEETDRKRSEQLKKIIEYAKANKKFVDYEWEKPSKEGQGYFPKRAYVELIEDLGLVLGTGTYTDDLETELEKFNETAAENIRKILTGFEETADKNISETTTKIFFGAAAFIVAMSLVLWSSLIRGKSLVDNKLAEVSRLIIKKQDDERNRISKDLHDSINPLLLANKMKIEVCTELFRQFVRGSGAVKSDDILEKLEASDAISAEAMVEVRRVINDLKPLPLETLGLEGAIRSFIDMHDINCGSLIEFNVSGEPRKLPSSTEYALLMVTRAAVNNAIKHSSATSISVDLIFNSRYTLLKISDDGDGIKTKLKDEGTGMGITNMKERIEAENGKFRLISSKKGTTVEAKVPYFMN